ncbi:MAG: hypothetical protein A2Z25_23140 [Planctomycetes bacterium RBG_16_55_9]|nr:MAG: hypothetical protein A2Z25_23140 [Planctomycetes bacterium RBG_16_55_9]
MAWQGHLFTTYFSGSILFILLIQSKTGRELDGVWYFFEKARAIRQEESFVLTRRFRLRTPSSFTIYNLLLTIVSAFIGVHLRFLFRQDLQDLQDLQD